WLAARVVERQIRCPAWRDREKGPDTDAVTREGEAGPAAGLRAEAGYLLPTIVANQQAGGVVCCHQHGPCLSAPVDEIQHRSAAWRDAESRAALGILPGELEEGRSVRQHS